MNKLAHIAHLIYQTPELSTYDNSFVYWKDDNENMVLHMNLYQRKKA